MKLLVILLGLLVALVLVVSLTERFGKPMDAQKQSRLSKVAMVLVFVLLIAQVILYWVRSGG
ncbi:hypothetical protein [Candidatus Sororendozoicomonas aggregata]|uniref:hypothetical protein n=1 Tax=Candidatus Sororendozoicomonas aggregata TaxID=3073239 RepID=UPI002ED66B11